MKPPPRAETLAKALRASEKELSTSRLGRLFGSGKVAARMAGAVLLRRRDDEDFDVERMARLVKEVGELKGVAMKAGQILGYIDPTLNGELRAMLSVLQTSSSASPWSRVEETVTGAFGARAPELLSVMVREPLAVASIGQVHRATLEGGREVVVKVRHPGIDVALTNDFKSAAAGSAFASLLVPGAGSSARGMVEEARAAMLEECDYALEADRQERFRGYFAGSRDVVIPQVVSEWSAKTVLTTEFRPGESLDAFVARAPSQDARDRVGEALFSFYVGTLYRHGSFHADPHPGNFAVLDGPRLVVYDFGCVRTFEREDVAQLAALTRAVVSDDRRSMARSFEALGGASATTPEVLEALRTLLRGFFAPMLTPGRHRIKLGPSLETRALMRDKRALMKLGVPGKLLFLFRLRFGLYAVLERLGAELDWAALEARAAARSDGGERSDMAVVLP